MEDKKVIGLGLLLLGTLLFFIGVLLLLDSALLIMSNIAYLMGIVALMGLQGFLDFVLQSDKKQGSILFFVGILLVFCKSPIPGIVCEGVGAYWLFGGFLPMLRSILLNLPHVGPYFAFLREESLPH